MSLCGVGSLRKKQLIPLLWSIQVRILRALILIFVDSSLLLESDGIFYYGISLLYPIPQMLGVVAYTTMAYLWLFLIPVEMKHF